MHHVDAEAAESEVGQETPRPRLRRKGDMLQQQEPSRGHAGHVQRVVCPEQLNLLRRLLRQGHDVTIAQVGDQEARHQQHQGHGPRPRQAPIHIVAQVVAQQEIAVEPGEVIEQPEGIPRAGAEGIRADELMEVGQQGAERPQPDEHLELLLRGPLHPRREDGHEEVEAYQHVDVPHVLRNEAERVGDAQDVGQAGGKGLAVALRPDEALVDDALVTAQHAREPRKEVVEHRPYQERPQHPQDALLVERPHRLADGKHQGARYHHEQRHARTDKGHPTLAPHQRGGIHRPARIGIGVCGRGIERVGRMAAQQKEKGKQPDGVQPDDLFLHTTGK